jgi:signal transduction histidine kinase
MESKRVKVLLIEDNPGDALLLREKLAEVSGASFNLEWSDRLSTGLERLGRGDLDVVLLDLSLPDSQGLDTLLRTFKHAPQVPIVVMTGLDDQDLGMKAVHEGAQDYLVKGQADGNMLVRSMHYAMERHRMIMQLEQTQKQELQMKDQFLSHVSHELRTPLNTLYQFVTILLDGLAGDINSEQREYLEIILAKTNELRTMVSDLLDVTRTKTGKIVIEPRHLPLVELISEMQASFQVAATAKGLTLSSNVPVDLPPAYADADRARQILTNLIDNALKFTAQGGTIAISAEVSEEDPNFICISVADTGSGISPEDRRRVFEYLYQANNSAEATRKGLGLGLYICKELVSYHGGRIWVQSSLGHGSTFFFTLPIFSVGKLVSRILTPQNLLEGSVSVMTIRISPPDKRQLSRNDEVALQEAWKVLQQCVNPGLDVLLPRMARTASAETLFVITCGSEPDTEDLMQRIRKQLARSSHLQDASLNVTTSCTTIHPASGLDNGPVGQLEKNVLDRIQDLVEAACQGRHSLYVRQ